MNNEKLTFTDEQNKNADINGDNTIDSSDASLILSYYSYSVNGGKDDMLTWYETFKKESV